MPLYNSIPGPWVTYTPTLANLTLGSGTSAASYIQIGKTVFLRWKFTLGAGSAVGTTPTFTLPVTANSSIYAQFDAIGVSTTNDSGTVYVGTTAFNSTTTAVPLYHAIVSAITRYAALSATAPFTFGSADYIFCEAEYEAA